MPKFIEHDDPLKVCAELKSEADSKIKPWQAEIRKDDCFYYYSVESGIVLWGEVLENQEDPLMHGYRFCRVFSVELPEGEVGDVHVAVIHKVISRQVFEKARAAGWPHDEVSFTRFAAQLQREKTAN